MQATATGRKSVQRIGWAYKALRSGVKPERDSKLVSNVDVLRVLEQQGSVTLLDVPLDVFFEILSYLEATDFVNVTRVSKVFQQVLAPRNAPFLWQAVLKVSNAPDCPSDWNIARWAVFLFGSLCNGCGEASALSTNYILRKRLCERCRDQCLVKFYDTASVLRQDHEKVLETAETPIILSDEQCNEVRKLTPSTHLEEMPILVWCIDDLLETACRLRRIRTDEALLGEFRQQQIKLVTELKQLSRHCTKWCRDLEVQRSRQQNRLLEE